MITIQIELKESVDEIETNIAKGTRDFLNIRFPTVLGEIRTLVRKRLYDGITSSPEYISMVNGKLRIELGLVDAADRLQNILERWINSVSVEFNKFRISKRNLAGGIKILAINADYSDVLSLPDSVLITDKGDVLPWLSWMLTYGSNIIIADYRIRFGPIGRTGGGAMYVGGSWGISPEYAGTLRDNFVIRSINSIKNEIEQEVTTIIKRCIS